MTFNARSTLVLIAAAACSGSGPVANGPLAGGPDGAWSLASIDGSALPAFLASETPREALLDVELGCELWATAGSLTLQPGGRYSRSDTQAESDCDDPDDNIEQTFSSAGAWTASGGSLSLVEDRQVGSLTADGTWSASTMILTFRETGILGEVETTARVYSR